MPVPLPGLGMLHAPSSLLPSTAVRREDGGSEELEARQGSKARQGSGGKAEEEAEGQGDRQEERGGEGFHPSFLPSFQKGNQEELKA